MTATAPSISEVEARFSKLRRNLDDGGYLESFGSDSFRLVEHLYNDLVETTGSLKKTLGEYAHYKKIAEELENGVLPFKEENVRLCRENSQLRIGIARALEDGEDKARDPLSRLRELEDENNDLKLLVSQFAERVKKVEIESLEKTKRIIQLQERELTPTVVTAAERGRQSSKTQHQIMEVDYFVPEACPQCIRLRNYVEYGKSSDRNPKTVDYIKLADSRIEALQLQLRSLKNMEKEHVSVISSLKTRVGTRDSEIEKLRDLVKVRAGSDNIRQGKGDKNCEIELKSAEMKLQILQLRNMELEEKLKKSIFQEHESYMLGKIPSHFGDRNLANIFLEKELDKYPSHDKMTLLEKLYYLEQQLSHCCKEKANLQRRIDECRLKHRPNDGVTQMVTFPSDEGHADIISNRKTMRGQTQPFKEKRENRRQLIADSPDLQVSANKISKNQVGGRIGSQTASKKSEARKRFIARPENAISQHEATSSSKAASVNAKGQGDQRDLDPDNESENGFDSLDVEQPEEDTDTVGDLIADKGLGSAHEYQGSVMHQTAEQDGKGSTNVIFTRTSKTPSTKQLRGSSISSIINTNIQKRVKHSSSNRSGSSGLKEDKLQKNVRISVEPRDIPIQATVEIDEYSSVDSSSDEDANANVSIEKYDSEDDNRNIRSTSKSDGVTSKTSEQFLVNQRAKSRKPLNIASSTEKITAQSLVRKRDDLSQAPGGGRNVLAKPNSRLTQHGKEDTTRGISKTNTKPFQGAVPRDKNAKVKSTISSRGNGKVSSSVITTAASVEDFQGAFQEGMEVSDDEELMEEMEYEREFHDDGRNYEEEEFQEGSPNLDKPPDEDHPREKYSQSGQSKRIEEPPQSRLAHQRGGGAVKQPRSDARGKSSSQQANDNRLLKDNRNQLQEQRNRDKSGTSSTKYAERPKARKFDSSDKSKSPLMEVEEDNDGSVVSYYDDEDEDSVGDVVADQRMRQQKQLHQRDSQRLNPTRDPNGNRNVSVSESQNARGSTSDSRLLQNLSTSDSVPGIVRDDMELHHASRQFKPSSKSSHKEPNTCSTRPSKTSEAAKSQGISAVQEPSLLSISEFEKENSDHEISTEVDCRKRGQQADRRGLNDPIRMYDSQSQPRRNLGQDMSRSQPSSSYKTRGEGDQPHDNMDKDIRQGDREMSDMEYGRGRGSDSGYTATGQGLASDSSQSRRALRDAPGFPMNRRSTSQLSREEHPSYEDVRSSNFNMRDKTSERSHPLTVGVNTEESRQFGLSWDSKMDDSLEKRKLLDKLSTLERKMEDLHAESSRHQLKSFELQGELERSKHMLQMEKQERELATSELRRAQDRNSETSARLLMNSSLGSDILRRGATPMEMEREVVNLRAALASLDRDKDEMRVELDRKDERLARVLHDSTQYMDEISQLKLRLKNADLQLSHTGESAKEQTREVDFLKKQVENTRHDLEKIIRERDEALKELHKISGAHAKGQMERRGVESELELKSKEADDLRKQVQRYIDEVRRIEELLLDKEEEMDMLIQHYRALTVENSNLEVQRTHLEKEASSIRESVKDAVDQNIGFKTQLASQNTLVQSLEEEIQRFTQQISQLENQLASKTEKEEMMAQDVKASKDLLYRLEVQMDKLKLDLADSDSKRKQLEVENAELAAHIASLETRLHDETDRQQQLEALVADSREKDFQNERSASNISRERDELAEKLTSLQQRSESLNSDVSRYRLKSIELQNELDRTRRQLDTEKRDRESAIAELRRAREQLHSSSANQLLKSALGSSGLQSEGSRQYSSPGSGSTFRQNLGGGGGGDDGFQRSSREQSPFLTPHAASDIPMDTPPNATSTARNQGRSEAQSPSVPGASGSSNNPPPSTRGNNERLDTWDSSN